MEHVRKEILILCTAQTLLTEKQKLLCEISTIPKEIASIEAIIKQYKDDLNSEKKILMSIEHKYRETENDLDDCTRAIHKSKEKLSQIKSNKEYQFTIKEIDILSEKQSDFEDIMFNWLEKIEDTKITIDKKIKLLTIRKETLLNEKNNYLTKQDQGRLLLKKLDKEIENIRKSADPKMLSTFDSIDKKVKGPLIIASVRNSVCLGCNMTIPPQLYNELQRFDKLNFCPYCSRIIYWNIEP